MTFGRHIIIINVSGDLSGFTVRLTSKHTSFECQIAEIESEKVVFKSFQTVLMPVKATYLCR